MERIFLRPYLSGILYRSVQRILEFQNGLHRTNESCGGLFAVENGLKELKKNEEINYGKKLPNFNFPIEFREVSLEYGSKKILKDLSFKIKPKEILGIAGPSGSGKSSIINIVTKLISPTSGTVFLGKDKFDVIDNLTFRSKDWLCDSRSIDYTRLIIGKYKFFQPSKEKDELRKVKLYMNLAGIENLNDRIHQNIYEAGKNFSED